MDRKGPRFVVEIGAILLTIGLALAPFAREPWQLYVTLGMLVGAGGEFPRLWRAVAIHPELVRAAARACDRHRVLRRRHRVDRAAALAAARHRRDGWRSACWLLALITLVVVVPLNLLLRRRPQEIGLHPDGDAAPDTPARRQARAQHRRSGMGRDRMDARARGAHRAVLVDRARLFGCGLYAWYAVQIHQTKYLTEIGVSANEAAWALGLVSLLGVPGQIIFGHVSDRIGREWVWAIGCAGFVICYLALIALQAGPTPWLALRHGAGAGLPRLFGDLGARPDRRRDLRGPAFRRDLRQRDAGGDRRRRGRARGSPACSTIAPATTSARSGSRWCSPASRPARSSWRRRARCGASRDACRNDFGAEISARSTGKGSIRLRRGGNDRAGRYRLW